MSDVDIVLIGRNEAQRLPAALAAAKRSGARLVYVDSGSSDGSPEIAQEMGAEVVRLDMSRPFTAARARNAGAAALHDPAPYLQFVDTDCVLAPGWIETAKDFLAQHQRHALVTGWAREEQPDHSVFNRLIDWEWRAPAGPIDACSGNLMVRRSSFDAVGGFDRGFIASEEEDLCARLASDGWALERLPEEMVTHDAGMTRLSEWWRRTERAGHGLAQLGAKHPGRRHTERWRAWLYGLALPVATLVLAVLWWPLVILPPAIYGRSWLSGYRTLRNTGTRPADARAFATLFTLAKAPVLVGMLRFYFRSMLRRDMRLIEYRKDRA
ncbi:glycosyltransferase family 2 protein [Roseivivax sp. THAF30]|uniref:glycosyltransferase n=1 Tax=Roseivivax sp. THAF30 TaxID=2587852 RepID=UPI0012692CE4|nr:glycosyltransferase [Roseivivax sp. THAF30]QFT61389.1 Glycosyl transferase family 2 [Roseivivax sp. THAF30]